MPKTPETDLLDQPPCALPPGPDAEGPSNVRTKALGSFEPSPTLWPLWGGSGVNSEQIWGYFLSKFEYTCIQLYSAVSRCIQMYSMCIQQPSRIHRIHAEYNHPLRIRNQPFIQMSSIPRIPCVLNVLYSTCVFCMYSECIHQYGFTTEYNRIPPHYYVVFYRTLNTVNTTYSTLSEIATSRIQNT